MPSTPPVSAAGQQPYAAPMQPPPAQQYSPPQQQMYAQQQQQYAPPPQYSPYPMTVAPNKKTPTGVVTGVIVGVIVLFVFVGVLIGIFSNMNRELSPEETALLGTWVCNDGPDHYWLCTLTFDSNGRFVDRDGDRGRFSVSGNRLTLSFDQYATERMTYRIDGNTLIITRVHEGENYHFYLQRQMG
jgi:hypothetical protein